MNILDELRELAEPSYAEFQQKLCPDLPASYFLGVRSPKLHALAKKLYKNNEYENFLKELPHTYFDEYMLHCFIINEMKDYDSCFKALTELVPYMNNWAITDAIHPRAFNGHEDELIAYVKEWVKAKEPFICREGIVLLMQYYLNNHFRKSYLNLVVSVKSDHYYVKMAKAWYLATAMVNYSDLVLAVLESHKLDIWSHNKTISKIVDSYRIAPELKERVRFMRR